MAPAARPLVAALLAFFSGLLLGLRHGGVDYPLSASLLLAPVALLSSRAYPRLARPGLWAAFVAVGFAFGGAERKAVAADCRLHVPDGAAVQLGGALAANVQALDFRDGAPPLLPVGTQWMRWQGGGAGCAAQVRVRFPERTPPLVAGTRIEVHGVWVKRGLPVVASAWPPNPRFGGFVAADTLVFVQAPALGSHPLLYLRGATEAHLLRLFPLHGPLADALLLGRRERVDPALRERFAQAGMAHLLAISGMHVGLLAVMMLVVIQWIRKFRAVSRAAAGGAVLVGTLLYLAVIGAPPSAVRAGVMICLAVVGTMLQRPYASLPIIAAAAFAILIHRPATALDPGFQLSFAGVLGILALRRMALDQLPEAWTADGWRRYLTETTVVSAAAFFSTAPVVVWHFGLLAPVGLISNLVAIPVMGLALAGVVLAAITGAVVPAVGRLLALGTEPAFFLLERIATVAAAIPFGHMTVARPAASVWVAACVGALGVARMAMRRPVPQRWALAAVTAAVILAAAPAVAGSAGLGEPRAEFHFLDVGQGDAIAIRTPGGRWVLVDAGPADPRFDAGERRVLPFLRAHGVRRLEAVVLTHPHADHIGGAVAVLEALPVGALIEPGYVTGSSHYLAVLRTAEARRVPWRPAESGRVLRLDGMTFEFLWPDPETLDGAGDANEISAILRVGFGSFHALLTGDAYAEQERILVERHGDALRSAVLKAGHHGSYTSTSAPLLDAVRPELVVISAGRRNRFGHPAPEVLADLRARNLRVARTDHAGTVSIVVRGGRTPSWYLQEP